MTLEIKSIAIVTRDGAKVYTIGHDDVTRILFKAKTITGDPLDYYFVYGKDGQPRAEVSALCPLEIEYKQQ